MSSKVWDSFTRIFHFSQLLLLATMWYSGEQGDFELHFLAGYALLALWLTRIIWGLFGSQTSRFSHFLISPRAIFRAWKDKTLLQPQAGHNPLAGYMILAMLLTLGVQLISGLFATDDVFTEGPLYAYASDGLATTLDSLHAQNFNLLLGLIALHAIAALVHVARGDNVIKSIVSGRKPLALPTPLHWRHSGFALCLWALLFGLLFFGWNPSELS